MVCLFLTNPVVNPRLNLTVAVCASALPHWKPLTAELRHKLMIAKLKAYSAKLFLTAVLYCRWREYNRNSTGTWQTRTTADKGLQYCFSLATFNRNLLLPAVLRDGETLAAQMQHVYHFTAALSCDSLDLPNTVLLLKTQVSSIHDTSLSKQHLTAASVFFSQWC